MAKWPLRFVHASDLHLERPLGDLAEIPDHLRDILCDAPYEAARRVFDAAVGQQVDFIVLAGDVVDVGSAGPRALAFLSDQFERMAAAGIAVYWSGGRSEARSPWPAALPLPAGVHLFEAGHVTSRVHSKAGEPIAELLGTSYTLRSPVGRDEFQRSRTDLPAIAMSYGKGELPASESGIVYWARGGKHGRQTSADGQTKAHFPGTPQGRKPGERGPHGFTLVDIDEASQVRTSLVPVDSVRWHDESLSAPEGMTSSELADMLAARAAEIQALHGGVELLVRWTVKARGDLAYELRRGSLSTDLQEQLRSAFSRGRPGLWTVSVASAAETEIPETLFGEETVIGQYLRTLEGYESDASQPLDFKHYVAERHMQNAIGSATAISDDAVRRQILKEAAVLGLDLLVGKEPQR